MNKQELASKIWESANRMRSKIEAHEYKDYILGFIFYRFLSENEVRWCLSQEFAEEDIRALSEDDPETVSWIQDNIGYFIAYKDLYSTWIEAGKDFEISNVRDALSAFNRLILPIRRQVFDGIFETLETGLSKLGTNAGEQTRAARDLLYLIQDIPMGDAADYDVLGFIYEYLISNFAANAGKKAGEFYTPHEVSVLISQIVAAHLAGREEITIYDPTSGSGSLLINIGKAVAAHSGRPNAIRYYAQELKQNTYNLTRMNLVMRGIAPANIVTRNGDTLEEDWPFFEENDPAGTYELLPVDAVVSNPPYSQAWNPEGKDTDPRYAYGLAPKSKADYAFLLHDLYHVKPDGVMAIVLPHGVLFRGGEEGTIRKNLLDYGHIEAIIGLPANIFFGTGIPTIIMVLRKSRKARDVLIVDASKGFEKAGKNNQLRECDIKKIVDVVTSRSEVEKFSRLVSLDEIRANGYNLNIPRYVDSSEEAEQWDLYASMFGGVPDAELDRLSAYWQALPGLREALFTSEGGYSHLRLGDVAELAGAIEGHPSAQAFAGGFAENFGRFQAQVEELLLGSPSEVEPTRAHGEVGDALFASLEDVPLVDRYEAYQVLADNWQVIEGDVEILKAEGLAAARGVVPVYAVKKQGGKDVSVQVATQGRIFPFELVECAFLSDQSAALRALEEELAGIPGQIEQLFEELPEEDKGHEVVAEDQSGWVAKEVARFAKEVRGQKKAGAHFEEGSLEAIALACDALLSQEKALKKKVKEARAALDEASAERIQALSEEDVIALLRMKWVAPLMESLLEMPQVALGTLEAKVKALVEKYSVTLAQVDHDIEVAERELIGMIDDLVGNEHDMLALAELKKLLGGELA